MCFYCIESQLVLVGILKDKAHFISNRKMPTSSDIPIVGSRRLQDCLTLK